MTATEKAAADAKAAAEKVFGDPAAKAAADALAAKEAKEAAERYANATCASGGKCSLGNTGPGGGIVFYDAGSMQSWGRYLEYAPDGWRGAKGDQEAVWCNVGNLFFTATVTDAKLKASLGTGIGFGKANTSLMLAGCTSGAAVISNAYRGGGKSDWFLPSKDELLKLNCYVMSGCTKLTNDVLGGFNRSRYWSSSEWNDLSALMVDFYNGSAYALEKQNAFSFRPIRAF